MWAGKIYPPSWWLSHIFSEWVISQPSVTGPPSMAGLTSQDRPSLEKSSGASPSSVWAGWQSTYAAGDKSPATKHNTYVLFCSTVKQFTTRTVSTSLTSSTEPIRDATFPKIVICNKYRLRWSNFFNSKVIYHIHGKDSNDIKLLHLPNLAQRQSFVDLLVPSVKNYTGTNYTDKDIGVAFYNHYIAGWGNTTQQVSLKVIGK